MSYLLNLNVLNVQRTITYNIHYNNVQYKIMKCMKIIQKVQSSLLKAVVVATTKSVLCRTKKHRA